MHELSDDGARHRFEVFLESSLISTLAKAAQVTLFCVTHKNIQTNKHHL